MRADNKGFRKIDIFGDDGQVVVSAPDVVIDSGRMILKGSDFGLIPHRKQIYGISYMEDGIVPFTAIVTLSTERQVNLDVQGAQAKEDRRDSLKVGTSSIETVIAVKSSGNSTRYIMTADDPIKMVNISMGGIGFQSNKPYFKHQRITINISCIRQDFVIEALVLRRNRLKPSENKYRYAYGCKFIGASEIKNRMLCEYVFKVQVENRKKQQEYEYD